MASLLSPEPHAMHIQRVPTVTESTMDDVDYSKVPRSSGDGMEHNGAAHEPSSQAINQKKLPRIQFTYQDTIATDKHQVSPHKTHVQALGVEHQRKVALKQGAPSSSETGDFPKHETPSKTLEERTDTFKSSESKRSHSKVSKRGTLSLVEATDLPKQDFHILENRTNKFISSGSKPSGALDNSIGIQDEKPRTSSTHLSTPSVELTTDRKSSEVSHDASEVQDARSSSEESRVLEVRISQLEEQNSKLADDKTKLVVQLGIQTEVNSDLKKLLVASMEDDLENRLEALVHRNAVLGIEVKHWKDLSQEYAEESDRLAIDCDVWRTKFMASRMMSDELSSWKTTLYSRYKQAQTVLRKFLDERTELQHHLIQTKRHLQSLAYVVKCSTGSYHDDSSLSERHSSHEQSILEMASISSCLAQELTSEVQGLLPSASLPTQTLLLTDDEHHKVDPTPAEKLAMQLLSSDVELSSADAPQESSVMKRMSQQYIGNSYQSRQMTNSFRVTYNCCDRCKGPVHVV